MSWIKGKVSPGVGSRGDSRIWPLGGLSPQEAADICPWQGIMRLLNVIQFFDLLEKAKIFGKSIYIMSIFDYPTMIYVQVPLTYSPTTKSAISPDETPDEQWSTFLPKKVVYYFIWL